jgi:hypothetical protein
MKVFFNLLAVFAMTLLIVTGASAQRSNSPSSRPSGLSSSRDMQERSLRMEHMADGLNKEKRNDPKLEAKQIREDFVRIQELNIQLLEAASKAPPIKIEMVVKVAQEVSERAQRLQSNLLLPEPSEQKDKDDANASSDDVILQIKSLDERITAFVTNPMFRSLQVIDQKLAKDANAELERVIDASRALQRNADKLRRAAEHN